MIAAMHAAFESLPDEILLGVRASITETLARRRQAMAPAKLLVNLCTGELPGPLTVESGADVNSTIATLTENAEKLVRTFSDQAIQQGLEYLEQWEDLNEAFVNRFLAEAISALMTFAIRKERDRRLQESAASRSQEAI